jgi:hypothetical protein
MIIRKSFPNNLIALMLIPDNSRELDQFRTKDLEIVPRKVAPEFKLLRKCCIMASLGQLVAPENNKS